jgi:hypothetical protein
MSVSTGIGTFMLPKCLCPPIPVILMLPKCLCPPVPEHICYRSVCAYLDILCAYQNTGLYLSQNTKMEAIGAKELRVMLDFEFYAFEMWSNSTGQHTNFRSLHVSTFGYCSWRTNVDLNVNGYGAEDRYKLKIIERYKTRLQMYLPCDKEPTQFNEQSPGPWMDRRGP